MASGLFHYYIIFQYLLGFTMNIIYILVLELFLFYVNLNKCAHFDQNQMPLTFFFEKKNNIYKTNRAFSMATQ